MKHSVITLLLSAIVGASGIAADPPKTKPAALSGRPLTYANAVSFFKSAHLRATEVQKRCTIFFEGEWTSANNYDYCLIIVENSDEDIQVTFYLTDAHEMNWVTEFIDSPFFSNAEKQSLFSSLNKRSDTGSKKIGRFAVDIHQWEPRHAQIIVFSFTPLRHT